MLIKYQIKKDVSQEELDKYRLKMFKKRRKSHEFAVGERVKMVFSNTEFVPKSRQWQVDYYGKICFGDNFENIPKYVVIEKITKTEIKVKNVDYFFRKELFEIYEDQVSD